MWKLISIYFTSADERDQNYFQIVKHFESEYGLKELYFARYNNEMGPNIQISVESSVLDNDRVENVVKKYKCVTNWFIEDRPPDDLSHAYTLAYSICKEFFRLDKTKKIEELFKLFHWTQNMLGFYYCEEADNYSNWSTHIRKNHLNNSSSD